MPVSLTILCVSSGDVAPQGCHAAQDGAVVGIAVEVFQQGYRRIRASLLPQPIRRTQQQGTWAGGTAPFSRSSVANPLPGPPCRRFGIAGGGRRPVFETAMLRALRMWFRSGQPQHLTAAGTPGNCCRHALSGIPRCLVQPAARMAAFFRAVKQIVHGRVHAGNSHIHMVFQIPVRIHDAPVDQQLCLFR